MGYTALQRMREKNLAEYGISDSVNIPDLPVTKRHYGREALLFIRDCCEDLKQDKQSAEHVNLSDCDGRSAGKRQIPHNMEKDLDRLSFESAVAEKVGFEPTHRLPQSTPLAGEPLTATWVLLHIDLIFSVFGGERGIRTPGAFQHHWFSRPAP